jgi:hypothetical protein
MPEPPKITQLLRIWAKRLCTMSDFGGTPDVSNTKECLAICIGSSRPEWLKVIKFDVVDVKPHLPYHVAFQIHVESMNITIKRIVIDEGASTSVMSLSCWKSIGSPPLSQSYDHVNYI